MTSSRTFYFLKTQRPFATNLNRIRVFTKPSSSLLEQQKLNPYVHVSNITNHAACVNSLPYEESAHKMSQL